MNIKTLMLGWEFPPFISGGLGTACHGLTKAMSRRGMQVTFLMPGQKPIHFRAGSQEAAEAFGQELSNVRIKAVPSSLRAYGQYGPEPVRRVTAAVEAELAEDLPEGPAPYGPSLEREVVRYARRVMKVAQHEDFDVIHAHDWMTFPAGIALATQSGKPLIVQVHSTEFDRSGEHVNQTVYDIEREGMSRAHKVIAVSQFTRGIVISRYGIPGDKVDVVYNGVERNGGWSAAPISIRREEKIVLFLGRITMQKGPEYFLQAAKKVLDVMDNVKFVMAGSGDLMHRSVELAAHLGIGHKVLFTGFLRGDDVRRIFGMADLYVMPSVSEPFGIAPLEALQNDVPVLISKQSGLAETFQNALKVDFWDVREMADKILAVLRHPPLGDLLRINGHREALRFRWEDAAARVDNIYQRVLHVA